MSISTEELIAINGLLIEREVAFARVGSIEQSINELLGGDYPFPAPEAIPPSTQKRKTKKKAARAAKPKGPPKLRRLRSPEVAYRIHTIEQGQPQQREATDLKPLEAIIKGTITGIRLSKVETLNSSGEAVEVIYQG